MESSRPKSRDAIARSEGHRGGTELLQDLEAGEPFAAGTVKMTIDVATVRRVVTDRRRAWSLTEARYVLLSRRT